MRNSDWSSDVCSSDLIGPEDRFDRIQDRRAADDLIERREEKIALLNPGHLQGLQALLGQRLQPGRKLRRPGGRQRPDGEEEALFTVERGLRRPGGNIDTWIDHRTLLRKRSRRRFPAGPARPGGRPAGGPAASSPFRARPRRSEEHTPE